jgi:hypothetical protein
MKFLETIYYGNTILDYSIVFGIILGAIIVGKILFILSKKVLKKNNS